MIVFENPGEIDPVAISTFGISVKEGDNPIGFFGTGMKYALAILLRNGHRVEVQSGTTTHVFATAARTVRGRSFDVVTMDDAPLGFTTEVGKTWELWMAYRELFCNMRDEGGRAFETSVVPTPQPGITRVLVDGAPFREIHHGCGEFILDTEPMIRTPFATIHPGAGSAIFYRGMKVMSLPAGQRTCRTFNLLSSIDLTEDRTAKYEWEVTQHLMDAVMTADDLGFVREALLHDEHTLESKFNYSNNWRKPSATFVAAVEDITRDAAAHVNMSAYQLYKKHTRQQLKPATIVLSQTDAAALARAKRFVEDSFGIEIDYPIVIAETLGEGCLAIADGGTIYLSHALFRAGTKKIAHALYEEYVHLKHGFADHTRQLQTFLFEQIIGLAEQIAGEPL